MESQQQIVKDKNLDDENLKNKTKEKSSNDGEEEVEQVSFFQMFRFADKYDKILMVVGSIAAAVMGTAFPAFAFIWGNMTNSFADSETMVDKAKDNLLIFIYVGIGAFFAGLLMFSCWMVTGERQGISCRKAYLKSLLRQEIGWFDVINQTELASKFASDTFAFQGAIGEKVSSIVMTCATLIAGFAFAFAVGWLMTLVMAATIPALGISGFFYMKVIGNKDKVAKKKYHTAGGNAEQAISAIKTVKQLNGEEYEARKYTQCLEEAGKSSSRYGFYAGLGIGSIFFVMLASYALGFWFGSKCILGTENCPESITGGRYTAGTVLTVFFSVIMAGFNLSQLTPAFKKIAEGKQAAARIYKIIDRDPMITNPPNGIKIQNMKGIFKFENVTFAYPKDPTHQVLKNLTM